MFGLPTEFKLIAGAAGVVALMVLGWFAYTTIEHQGEARATAALQPKIDAANIKIGALTTANDANLETIKQMTANDAANEALSQEQADRVTALNQQAADSASVIRKLQNDDKDVAAFLATRIPDALRGVLPYAPARSQPAAASGADKNGRPPAAKAK